MATKKIPEAKMRIFKIPVISQDEVNSLENDISQVAEDDFFPDDENGPVDQNRIAAGYLEENDKIQIDYITYKPTKETWAYLYIKEDTIGKYLYMTEEMLPYFKNKTSAAKNYDTLTKFYIKGTTKYEQKLLSIAESNKTDISTFVFYRNPDHWNEAWNKNKTKMKSRVGWEFQHWGNDIMVISVQGKTGGMLESEPYQAVTEENTGVVGASRTYLKNKFIKPPPASISKKQIAITKTEAYRKLSELKALYKEDHDDRNAEDILLLGLYYRDTVYVGHFDSFTFDEDKDQPYLFDYSFKFSVESIDDTTTNISKLSTNLVKNNLKRRTAAEIKDIKEQF